MAKSHSIFVATPHLTPALLDRSSIIEEMPKDTGFQMTKNLPNVLSNRASLCGALGVSFLRVSGALQLTIFEQPGEDDFFSRLLEISE